MAGLRGCRRRRTSRLERAHRERLAELEQERAARLRAAQAVLKARRLIAHRELQQIRAGALGRRKYIARRTVKVDESYAELAAALERARALGLDLG